MSAERSPPRLRHPGAHLARPAGIGRCIVGVLALSTLVPEQGYTLNILMQAATYAIAVVGLVVVLGYCGQISIAQAAFFGLGAYGVALGTVDYGLPFFAALAAGVALAHCSAWCSASPACGSAATTSPWSRSASSRS